MMKRGMGLPSPPLRWPVSITCEISVLTSMMSPTLALSGSLTRALFIAPVLRNRLCLAAAPADRHFHCPPRHQEPAVAELGQADQVLRAGESQAARHRGPARQRREPEGGDAGQRIRGGDDVNRPHVILL